MLARRRGRRALLIAQLAASALATACCRAPSTVSAAPSTEVRADHHVHILSPELVDDWKSLGVPFSRPDSAYTSVTAVFPPGHSPSAFLVSMAHVYGSEEFRGALGLSVDEEQARVRLANAHVAGEVGRAPDRYVGFCSVHPLRPYGASEIEHCRGELGLAGLKLHLPSSGLDLGDRSHLRVLAEIARQAEREQRPLLLHLVAVESELTPEQLASFLEQVVRPHPGLELYLAHLGGNGGYRVSARRLIRAFTDFLQESEENGRRPVYFELSGVLLAQTTDGVPASRGSEIRRLARDLERLGLRRVLFGSDHPVFDPGEYAQLLRDKLPLSPAELTQILTNRAPALQRAAERHAVASRSMRRSGGGASTPASAPTGPCSRRGDSGRRFRSRPGPAGREPPRS